MRQTILLALLIIILAGGTALCLSQSDSDEMSLETMDNSVFENPSRPPAVFDHDLHNEMAGLEDDCAVCHHVYEDGELVADESSEDSLCSECHALKKAADNPVPLRMAYHKRCKTCHFTEKKGPVLCGECHINKGRL